MSNQTDADKNLQLLIAEGNNALAGTDQHKSNFDTFLTQMASSENVDPAMRQAALQMRLPDTKVSRNEDGNLSFTSRSPKDDKLPDAFKSKRLSTVDANSTIIIGEDNEVKVFDLGVQGFHDQARRANRLHGTNNRRTANLLNQLDGISQIDDLKERERSLIDLSGSIELALNDRKLELIEQAGMRFNVPDLERRLREAETADRADPRWAEFQHDSPLTQQLRAETERARQNAISEADRSYLTDSVTNELSVKRKQVIDRLQLDVDSFKKGSTPDELFAVMDQDDQLMATNMFKASVGRDPKDKKEVLEYMRTNETFLALQQKDQQAVVVHAFTPGTTDQANIRRALYGAESELVGHASAERRIGNVDMALKRLTAFLGADDGELSKYADMMQNAAAVDLREAQNDPQLNLTAKQQSDFKASLPGRLTEIAQATALAQEVDYFLSSQDVYLPSSSDPNIQAIVEKARNEAHTVDWLIAQAAEGPVQQQAVSDYLLAAWRDSMNSMVLGRGVDTQALLASRIKAKYMGLSGDSIVMGGTTPIQHYIAEPMEDFGEYITQDSALRDSLQAMVTNPFGLVDWLSTPVARENDK